MRGPTRPVAVTRIAKMPGTGRGAASAAATIASRGAMRADCCVGAAATDSTPKAMRERVLIMPPCGKIIKRTQGLDQIDRACEFLARGFNGVGRPYMTGSTGGEKAMRVLLLFALLAGAAPALAQA